MFASTAVDEYDLFYRAIVAGESDAWSIIHERYGRLMRSWARRCTLFDLSADSCEEIADEALARAWHALTPQHFQRFTDLKALMAYLRACVTSTVIDSVRKQDVNNKKRMPLNDFASDSYEELIIAHLSQVELYELVMRHLKDDVERVVLYERFMLDLPPRCIQQRHPELFPDVKLVYTCQRNLCERLRRDTMFVELVTCSTHT